MQCRHLRDISGELLYRAYRPKVLAHNFACALEWAFISGGIKQFQSSRLTELGHVSGTAHVEDLGIHEQWVQLAPRLLGRHQALGGSHIEFLIFGFKASVHTSRSRAAHACIPRLEMVNIKFLGH